MARAERAAARDASRALDGAPVAEAPPEAVCIICLDRGDEPLHRNCACRGPTAGFAHMSCLVRYAASAAETDAMRWRECGTCKQHYFGATQLGLARARFERAQGLPFRAPGRADRRRARQCQVRGEPKGVCGLESVTKLTRCATTSAATRGRGT